jgi:hypothetical protein
MSCSFIVAKYRIHKFTILIIIVKNKILLNLRCEASASSAFQKRFVFLRINLLNAIHEINYLIPDIYLSDNQRIIRSKS